MADKIYDALKKGGLTITQIGMIGRCPMCERHLRGYRLQAAARKLRARGMGLFAGERGTWIPASGKA